MSCRRTPFYHAVIVRDCSRVKGSPHRKNQLNLLRHLATIHERYGGTDRQTDRFTVAWTRCTQLTKRGVSENFLNGTSEQIRPFRAITGLRLISLS